MSKSRFSDEQIIAILKVHEEGRPTAEVCRQHGISQPTFYAWKSKLTRLACVLALAGVALTIHLPAGANAAPDEALLGKAAGYPIGTARNWFYEEGVRVGSFSNLDRILRHNTLRRAATPSKLEWAAMAAPITYWFEGRRLTLADFLERQRITGLMLISRGKVLAEHYQYDRSARHRFVSHSMAKSITSLAVGLAVAEGRIRTLDDTVARYVPQLAGSAYGETTVRNLLRMSSGVPFTETYDGKDDLARFGRTRWRQGTVAAIKLFSERTLPQGTRFKYASVETVVLAMLLRQATGGSLSAYLAERLWRPMGAEADATWITTPSDGTEVASGSFNAVLRDYGRLGILLANDGAIDGRQILPRDYLLEATDWHRHPDVFHPRRATPYFGYGYQFWLYPGEKRRFALLGVYGQSIFVDPGAKLVLVITAVARNASVSKESLARERDALWRGIVAAHGSW